jgi:hypothetical protein
MEPATTTSPPATTPPSEASATEDAVDTRVDVVRILLLVQGGIAVTSTIEVFLVGAFTGFFIAPLMALTLTAAIVTLWASHGVRLRSRRARKVTFWAEGAIVVFAIFDLLLAIFLARRGLALVPTVTRIVLPIAIMRTLRRPQVRAEFGIVPASVTAEGRP